MNERFFAQFGEDRLLNELFRSKPQGACVEVGANDGIHGSNTLFFERLGWTCILVEPNPDLCVLLRQYRSKSQVFESAASDHAGMTTLHIAEGAELAHGTSMIGETDDAVHRLAGLGFSSRPVRVVTQTLNSIMEATGLKNVDFATIDVEGHELEVLAGFDLVRWRPTVLIVEDNTEFSDRRVEHYLRDRGYVPFRRTGVNDWYAPASHVFTNLSRRAVYGWFRRTVVLRRIVCRFKTALSHVPGVFWIRDRLTR